MTIKKILEKAEKNIEKTRIASLKKEARSIKKDCLKKVKAIKKGERIRIKYPRSTSGDAYDIKWLLQHKYGMSGVEIKITNNHALLIIL